jgi:hypothetical protein
MSEAQAHEFYQDPEHLAAVGPGQRRERPMKTGMIPVRFSPETIAAVKRFASQDGVTVSTWVRRLVGRELQRLQPSATAASEAPSIRLDSSPSIRPQSQTVSRAENGQFAAMC